MSSQETYQRFAQYYDLYVGDFNADLPLYRSLCAPEHRVLEIGCGTGRVLRAVLEAGCCGWPKQNCVRILCRRSWS